MSGALGRPGSRRIWYLPSGPFSLYSTTSCSILSPATSVIALIVMPSNSRPKEWPTLLSPSGSAMLLLPFSRLRRGGEPVCFRRRAGVQGGRPPCLLFADQTRSAGVLRKSEDHELR